MTQLSVFSFTDHFDRTSTIFITSELLTVTLHLLRLLLST